MAGIPQGDVGRFSFLKRNEFYDICMVICGLVVGGISAWCLWDTWHHRSAVTVVTISVLGILLAVGRLRLVVKEVKKEASPPHDLEAALETVYSIISQDPANAFPNLKLRATIHVPKKDGDDVHLRQIMDYIGNGSGGSTNHRRFPVSCGVIGLAYRSRDIAFGQRKNDDFELYIKELVKDWGYTEEAARALNHRSNAWLAIPLTHDDKKGNQVVAGIVYFDSTEKAFFDDTRKAVAACACLGIAKFVRRRYS